MMQKWNRILKRITLMGAVLFLIALASTKMEVQAAEPATIKKGVYAGDINLSGMTEEEATQAVKEYIEGLETIPITLIAGGDQQIKTTAGQLGLFWANTGMIKDALELGTVGNVIERYKAAKDLEHENKIYSIDYDFSMAKINAFLLEECAKYDQDAIDGSLKRVNGSFEIVGGQQGYHLEIENSIDNIYHYLAKEWNREAGTIDLSVEIVAPRGSREELAQVTDVIGSFTTSFANSDSGRSTNVTRGCTLINGTLLYPGDEFSTTQCIAPITTENGYDIGGAYLNGQLVDSVGGGVCQVSTTLYNAVLLAELEVTKRYNHSMTVTYVDPSADAAIAQSSGKDFCFVNNTDTPIYIEGYISNKKITFNIYGKETRSATRKVSYVSEVLETTPVAEQLNADASQPLGYLSVGGSPHTGYKARLWKVVTENGVEVSREQVNSSTYKMSPRIATVGVATDDPNAYNEIMAAIGVGSIDHVRNVLALLLPPAPAE